VRTHPHAIPRLTPPRLESHGLLMFTLVDTDGSPIRCLQNET
jgi:hypothetical protein